MDFFRLDDKHLKLGPENVVFSEKYVSKVTPRKQTRSAGSNSWRRNHSRF